MGVVVRRWELDEFLGGGGRRLLFGRRKTGKTFYSRLFLRDYDYFIVRRGGSFYDPVSGDELGLRAFLRLCRSGGLIVDEFHRADPRFFDALQANECSREMVLITSTLHYFRRFCEGGDAPLAGLFSMKRVNPLSPVDLLRHDWGRDLSKGFIELLVLYQEPSLIGLDLKGIVLTGRELVNALVGEVLEEEDVTYSSRFKAILEAVASGRDRLTEIASYLHSRGFIPSSSTSHVVKYVNALIYSGLLERVDLWGRRRGSRYRHVSPLTDLEYYLNAKYGFFDTPVTWRFVERVIRERLPKLVERFVERLLAEVEGLKPVKVIDPEIDIALTKFRKIAVVAEVKWVNRVRKDDVRKAEDKLSRFPEARKLLIVPDSSGVPETWLEVVDIPKLVRLSK
jgi:hypothetical protein